MTSSISIRPRRCTATLRIRPGETGTQLARRLGEGQGYAVTLYRFADEAGRLLYVGITSRRADRWTQHRRTAAWWPAASTVTAKQYPNEWTALDAERAAIKAERPLHNKRSAV